MVNRFARALLLAVIAVGAVGAFWYFRVIAPIRVHAVSPENYDDFIYYSPTFTYAFGELRAGRFPLWNPYQHAGTPFFATAQHLLLYPLNVLYLLLPTPQAMAGTTLLHLVLALLFTFALARTIGLSVAAGATAAVAYGFSTTLAALIYLPHHLYGAVWIPLLLALVHRVVCGPRRLAAAIGLGAAAATQYLGSYPMFCLFSAYACAGYALWLLVGRWRAAAPAAELGSALTALAAAALLAAALSAPQLLPATELAARSPRAFTALTIDDIDPYYRAIDPTDVLASALFPGRDAKIFRPLPHVGIVALALACLAVAHRARRRDAGFFALLALGSGLIGLGRHTPLFALYYHLPTANWFRIPDRFYVLTALGLALLAGIGADWLLRRARAWARRALSVALPAAAYASLFITFINRAALPETDPSVHVMPPAVVWYLRGHQDFARTYIPPPWLYGYGTVPSKSGMLYGLYVATDRENLYVARFYEYVMRMQNPTEATVIGEAFQQFFGNLSATPQGEYEVHTASPNLRLFDLLGTRYIVVGPGIKFQRGGRREFPLVFKDGAIAVYRNPEALPRAFVVHRFEVVPGAAVLDRLVDPTFDPRAAVILEQPPTEPIAPPASASQARILSYAADEVVIETRTDAAGLLVLTDQDYPGWESEVDGTPAPIYRANYLFRAVPVPAGSHRVVFRFRPRSFERGVAISAASLATLGLVGLVFAWRGRRRGEI